MAEETTPLLLPTRHPATPPNEEQVLQLLEQYPLPPTTVFQYGTAGFRYHAVDLDCVMVRVGLLAALRASLLKQSVGVMVTASHNDESYNGVKLADPTGGMMGLEGERQAVYMTNERNTTTLQTYLKQQQQQSTVAATTTTTISPPTVHLGRDTRSHSPRFADLVTQAARAMGAMVVDHGIVTTPMLHAAVLHANPVHLPLQIPVRPNRGGYYELLCWSYAGLLETREDTQTNPPPSLPPLVVDCACGVGYPHVQYVADQLVRMGLPNRLVATNAPGAGPLNQGCGSEHVQKGLVPPVWYHEKDDSDSSIPKEYCACLDGDADRIVFLSLEPEFCLLDGDKIACLMCDFLQEQLAAVQAGCSDDAAALPALKLGVVQTAYANGASTAYLKTVLGHDCVLIAKTGVKHVHKAAHEHFDVGVYFEANGHGTVLFGPAFFRFLHAADALLTGTPSSANRALQRLRLLPALINPTVGDALSDLLFVDAILQLQQRSVADWKGLYQDLPSRQSVVKVPDRTVVKTNDNETVCLAPAGLQDKLQERMLEFEGRAFIRPSGTEDVVRIYAEAPTRQAADDLAQAAANLVKEMC